MGQVRDFREHIFLPYALNEIAPLQADRAMGTGQATDTGGQCANAIKAGVAADGPAHMHTVREAGALSRQKAGTELPT